jgi:hypothetical protein
MRPKMEAPVEFVAYIEACCPAATLSIQTQAVVESQAKKIFWGRAASLSMAAWKISGDPE